MCRRHRRRPPFRPSSRPNPTISAVLLLTSGVSATPKAAMLSHGNLDWMQRTLLNGVNGPTTDDRTLGVLPFTHIFGLNVVLLTGLRLVRVSISSTASVLDPEAPRQPASARMPRCPTAPHLGCRPSRPGRPRPRTRLDRPRRPRSGRTRRSSARPNTAAPTWRRSSPTPSASTCSSPVSELIAAGQGVDRGGT